MLAHHLRFPPQKGNALTGVLDRVRAELPSPLTPRAPASHPKVSPCAGSGWTLSTWNSPNVPASQIQSVFHREIPLPETLGFHPRGGGRERHPRAEAEGGCAGHVHRQRLLPARSSREPGTRPGDQLGHSLSNGFYSKSEPRTHRKLSAIRGVPRDKPLATLVKVLVKRHLQPEATSSGAEQIPRPASNHLDDRSSWWVYPNLIASWTPHVTDRCLVCFGKRVHQATLR
jgi:hypothetical protein